jgi:beta-fructofuranosidase
VDELDAAHRRALARADASVAAAAAQAAEDPSRPIYHLTSPACWINDPNGPVYYDGEYHVFFQHNPFGSEWGRMFWGHAVSGDLVHWEHLPIALAPNPGSYDKDGVFSGCCVVHEGVPTILYTGVSPECQCIATSGPHRAPISRDSATPSAGETADGGTWRWGAASGAKEDACSCTARQTSVNGFTSVFSTGVRPT